MEISAHPYSPTTTLSTHSTGGWVGPRAVLELEVRRSPFPCQEINIPRTSKFALVFYTVLGIKVNDGMLMNSNTGRTRRKATDICFIVILININMNIYTMQPLI
jgi:hypothetical protein